MTNFQTPTDRPAHPRSRYNLAATLCLGASAVLLAGTAVAQEIAADAVPPVAAPSIGQQVDVTILGGATVTGTLLRESDKGLVVDLGFSALSIPADQVLDMRSTDPDADTGETHDAGDGVFRTGRLEPASIPKLVERYGDAVVMVKTPSGLGSGFVISDQKHLITNYHVIEEQTTISVTVFQPSTQGYQRREFHEVQIIAVNPLRDIALLRVVDEKAEDWKPTPVVITEDGGPQVGDLIFAVGNPLGLERSVTQGIVSSRSRNIGHLRMIQTDASINPGNSGGPMFNARGEVVGIVCAGATSFNGLAFGIPASDLVDFLQNRDAYLFDPSQPMNGITYLQPPYKPAPAEIPPEATPVADP